MAIVINPISPVAFSVFGIPVRWYALAYIAGFVFGFYLLKHLVNRSDAQIKLNKKQLDDFLTTIVIGVIVGGRLGYVLFYDFPYFIKHPLEILALWHGGMSFHGGLLGVIVATVIFIMMQKIKPVAKNSLKMLDLMAVVTPIGLGLGRIANFINMEVMGRATDSPLGVIFVGGPNYARHPSPLYEATLEGAVLFIIMLMLYNKTNLKKFPGALGGILCMLYAGFRIFCEQFRQPDAQLGFLTSWGLTMGQLLSGLMFAVGVGVFMYAMNHKNKN
ncbi:MAG: prolipoprotein diacylglyceryl transferase [Alphaproteobacteria bacterium]|nr:prolipoprotein diacylglyceryl transferase [Alphaproteobacteria bacterium]